MAKSKGRKTTAKRSSKSKGKTIKQDNMNLSVVGTIIFSILLAVLLYTNSGEIGQKLNELLGGLMGILRYILPIGTFAIAIKMACKEEEDYVTNKLVQYAILLICIAVIMSIYEISKGSIDILGDMSQNLKKAYSLGIINKGRRSDRNLSCHIFS